MCTCFPYTTTGCEDRIVNGGGWLGAETAPSTAVKSEVVRASVRTYYRRQCAAELSEAAGLGFEPRLPGPEPGVLPLDDPATRRGL
jgi:hypothetical protein